MPLVQHARMKQDTGSRQIFIPLDERNLDALRADDRLVAYRPGFGLLGQVSPPSAAQQLTGSVSGSADRLCEHPAGLPYPR